MGGPYESSFGLGRRPASIRLGEELRLELDPRIQAWMTVMLREGDLGRARSYAKAPVWRGFELEERELFGPRLTPSGADPAPVTVFRPIVAPTIPLCPTSKPPDPPKPPKPGEEPPKPKAGDVEDVLGALSKTEVWQCTVDRVFDTVERNAQRDWRRLSTTEKIGVVTASAVLASGAVAGILSDSEARKLALDKLYGADLPVPGVRGLSFKILKAEKPPQAPGPLPGPTPPVDDTPRPVGVFFTLDVPKFLQNFQRLPAFKVGN
jgi:hypothetical protein